MINLIKKLFQRNKTPIIEHITTTMLNSLKKDSLIYPLSKHDMGECLNNQEVCPDCGMDAHLYMLGGPSGGGCVNIKCSYCGSFFNNMGVFGVERINYFNHDKEIGSNTLKYLPPQPVVIQKWHNVSLTRNYDFSELYAWCEERCTGLWSVKSGLLNNGGLMPKSIESTFFFSEPNDLLIFKLTFS